MIRQLCLAAALLCLLPATMVVRVEAKTGKSLVVGGIAPCTGLAPPMIKNLPHYAAGTVFVLKGQMVRTRQGGLRLPKHVVTQQTVGVNRTYRFALAPGRYVLVAYLPHSNVRPFVKVNVREGVRIHIDIPDLCK